MSADRWERVGRVLDVVLDSDPSQWRKALEETCGGDAELRREVEGLLSRYASAQHFLEVPPAAAAAALLAEVRGTPGNQPADDVGRHHESNALRPEEGAPGAVAHPGARLAHYEILSAIGRGGMGEVWKARDTKLHRLVAIKLLPPEFAQTPDRLARLEREARSLAAVNHAHVAAIHSLEEHAGSRFLVLEYVEGDTLADRLARGSIPVEQSLEIALQIAGALEAAHEKGVVHRDLKPGNIKLTPDGRIKVLDFGLAKTFARPGNDASLPTAPETELGAILGTPPYMSPEQVRGEATGPQTDIWALGVVLYEMLTGRSPFDRGTTAGTLARVLEAEPDFGVLPARTPATARHLLRHCLEKEPRRRMKDAGDVRLSVEDALEQLATPPAPTGPVVPASDKRTRWARVSRVGALLALVAGGGFSAWWLANGSEPGAGAEVVRLSIRSEQRPGSWPFGVRHVAISRDGSRVAFAGSMGISIRRMDDGQTVLVSPVGYNPFFSPDGEWIGFYGDNGYRRAPSGGGSSVQITPVTERGTGATWGPDDTIVFGTTSGLYRVAASGGEPRLLVGPDRAAGEIFYAWPEFLPDGGSVLFTIVREDSRAEPQIARLNLETLEKNIVLTGGTGARFVAPGHLAYTSGGVLTAVAFDLASHSPRGQPVPFPDVAISTAQDNGAAELAVSASGTLVSIAPSERRLRRLYWIDREGNEEPLALEPGHYTYPRLSPDGTRLAIEVTGENRDIWIGDLGRATLARLTTGPTEDMLPVWSPDGTRIFFGSDRAGNFDVYSQPADGSTDAQVEIARRQFEVPLALTPDGSRLIFLEEYRDISLLELATADPQPLLHREFNTWLAEVSPDGQWLAYESDESGDQVEIYVRPFPNVSGRREKVSLDGGRFPRWGPAGSNELYYVDPAGDMLAASIQLSPTLRLGSVTKLFPTARPQSLPAGRPYDVSEIDGRFILLKPEAPAGQGTNISVVLNWFEELHERVPAP